MKQISSSSTPFLKYILPWAIITALTVGIIAALIGRQFGLAFGTIIIGVVVIGFMKTMLMGLKKVFLDKENKILVVKGSAEESIPYADIKEILRPWTPPYIATVRLTKDYSFGKAFTFVPEGHPVFWENYDEELKSKMRK
jgi:hypothetical protein